MQDQYQYHLIFEFDFIFQGTERDLNSYQSTEFHTGPKLRHRFADDKNKYDSNDEICLRKSRKFCGKRRKYWLPAFSPFSTMFSKVLVLFSRVLKIWDLEVLC